MTQVTNPTPPAISQPIGGGGGGSTVIGIQTDNRLNGTPGSDFFQTFGGNDVIAGGDGNDLIITGGGNDSIGGGGGNDTIISGSGNDVVAGGRDNDLIFGGKGSDLVDGGEGDDLISGDRGNDTVLGGSGSDTVFGGRENDVVGGGDGNDILYGGRDNDTVDGGAGNDFISGDRGSDVLTGGSGSDTFYFASPAGGDFGVDTITDFTPGEDKIKLKSTGVFNSLGSSVDSTEFVIDAGFTGTPTAATTNKLVYNPQSGLLYFNAGNGVVTIAQLQPGLTISPNNFEMF